MSNISTANSSTESKALELLSQGIEPVHVASALAVSESRISQLISDPVFSLKLAELKFESLRKHNATDNEYDALEKQLLEQLKRSVGMIMDPMKLARIISVVNSAKRRGSSAPESLTRQRPTVRLNINTAVVTRFSLNGANQVVQASVGDDVQDLVTVQSGAMQTLLKDAMASANPPMLVEPQVDKNSREHRNYRREVRAEEAAQEIEGRVWSKPQGREYRDLLSECGFVAEVEISQPAGGEA